MSCNYWGDNVKMYFTWLALYIYFHWWQRVVTVCFRINTGIWPMKNVTTYLHIYSFIYTVTQPGFNRSVRIIQPMIRLFIEIRYTCILLKSYNLSHINLKHLWYWKVRFNVTLSFYRICQSLLSPVCPQKRDLLGLESQLGVKT